MDDPTTNNDAAAPVATKPPRKPRSDKGRVKAKGKKASTRIPVRIMYRTGDIVETPSPDGTTKTVVTWLKEAGDTGMPNRAAAVQYVTRLAQNPDTAAKFDGKRIQIVAIMDEFTIKTEIKARAQVVR